MFKKLDAKKIITLDMARSEYPKSKILFIVTDMSNMSSIQGYISAISDADDSFNELCEEEDQYRNQGIQTIIIGSYENGGGIGVQYEL